MQYNMKDDHDNYLILSHYLDEFYLDDEYTVIAKFGKTCTCDRRTGIATPFGNVHLTDFLFFTNGTTFSGKLSILIFLLVDQV